MRLDDSPRPNGRERGRQPARSSIGGVDLDRGPVETVGRGRSCRSCGDDLSRTDCHAVATVLVHGYDGLRTRSVRFCDPQCMDAWSPGETA